MYRRILQIGVVVIVALALIAWEPSMTASPYTGTFSRQYLSTGVRSNGRSIKWNAAGVNEIKNNIWIEYFDQTADCTSNSPNGDKLYPDYAVTSMPNGGVFRYNDCDGPLPDVTEEVELQLTSGSVVAETAYQYDVVWRCNSRNQSGEINITFELGDIGSKDWLDKVTYAFTACGPYAPLPADSSLARDEDSPIRSVELFSRALIGTRTDPTGLYAYQILRTSQGNLRARVLVNFLDVDTFQKYRQLNRNLAAVLSATGEPVLTVITFASPLTVGEARALAEQTGLSVLSYGAFGFNTSREQVAVYDWSETQMVEELPVIKGIDLKGIMTMTVLVKPETSDLGALIGDERIVLLDVVSSQIKERIEAEMREPIDVTQIGVPNPAWSFASSMIRVP